MPVTPELPHNSTILNIEEEKAHVRRKMREDQEYLRTLDGLRARYSRALDVEYVYEKLLLKRQKGIRSIPTGVQWWDDWAGPFRRANVYCIAGYQGAGKTGLAINLTWPMAVAGMKIWNFCLELTAEETFEVVGGHALGRRIVTEADEVEAYAIIKPTGYRFFEPERDLNWKQNIDCICDTVRMDKIDLVVIDNFSYLTSVDKNSYETERVAAKALKGLSQELEVPIVVLAHLRKPDRDDTEPEPTAHSVLGSGALTQLASDVFILHRPLIGDENQSRYPVGYILSGKPRWTKGGKRYIDYNGDSITFNPSTSEKYKNRKKSAPSMYDPIDYE